MIVSIYEKIPVQPQLLLKNADSGIIIGYIKGAVSMAV